MARRGGHSMPQRDGEGGGSGEVPDAEGGVPEGLEAEEAPDPAPEVRLRPFQMPTEVQPKMIVEESVYRNAEADMVKNAFNQGSYLGIRSLPNALKPDFRQQLYERILLDAKQKVSVPTPSKGVSMPSAASQAHAAGQKKPSKFSGVGNYFSIYEYMKDPFERHKAATIEERRKGKELWVGSEDFKKTALPQVPRNAGSFHEFKYTINPYEQKDEYQKLMKKKSDSKILHGPVRAGGTVSDNELTKIRSNEAIDRLDRMLRKDWDDAFVDVFEDVSGCIVMCFEKERIGDGDITSYMNLMARANDIVKEFSLKKDASRWGVTDADVPQVYYVFWPPWVHKKATIPESLHQPEGTMFLNYNPPLLSGRIPFGPQTATGVPIDVHVRTHSRSFKF